MHVRPEITNIFKQITHPVILIGSELADTSQLPNFAEDPNYRPAFNAQAYALNPSIAWGLQEHILHRVQQAKPSRAHFAIHQLSTLFKAARLYSLTIDDLLQQAGCQQVQGLYGNIAEFRCSLNTSMQIKSSGLFMPEACSENPNYDLQSKICLKCGSPLRFNLVMEGEPLQGLEEAGNFIAQADGLIVIGTNPKQFPANQIIPVATSRRIPLIEFSKKPGIQFTASCPQPGELTQTLPDFVQALLACQST
jgi:NAD-dependent deacetylase